MHAGKLRHYGRIVAQAQPSPTTRDSYGDPIPVWEPVVPSLWMEVLALTGDELVAARQVHARTTHRIITRWMPDVTPDMRVEWEGRRLEIVSALDPDGRRKELHLLAVEVNR